MKALAQSWSRLRFSPNKLDLKSNPEHQGRENSHPNITILATNSMLYSLEKYENTATHPATTQNKSPDTGAGHAFSHQNPKVFSLATERVILKQSLVYS